MNNNDYSVTSGYAVVTSSVLQRELAGLNYQALEPNVELKPWVEHYWFIHTNEINLPQRFRMHPDGGSSLVFHLKEDGNGGITMLTKPLRKNFYQQINPGQCSFGIRFKPGGCFALLGHSPLQLMDAGFEQGAYQRLHETLLLLQNHELRLNALNEWCFELLKQRQPAQGVIQYWLKATATSIYRPSEELSKLGISRRRLERTFRQQVGIAPGQLHNLLRIKQARCLLRDRLDLTLSDVAQLCGYFDQAHFHRNFKQLVNESPRVFQQRKLSQIYNK